MSSRKLFIPEALKRECREKFDCRVNICMKNYGIYICDLEARTPGRGDGTGCMLWLMDNIHKSGFKDVYLTAGPIERKDPDRTHSDCCRLVKWYQQFGFEIVREYFQKENMGMLDRVEMVARV